MANKYQESIEALFDFYPAKLTTDAANAYLRVFKHFPADEVRNAVRDVIGKWQRIGYGSPVMPRATDVVAFIRNGPDRLAEALRQQAPKTEHAGITFRDIQVSALTAALNGDEPPHKIQLLPLKTKLNGYRTVKALPLNEDDDDGLPREDCEFWLERLRQ